MNLATKIACRTLGAAAMGVVLYDAVRVGKHHSKVEGEKEASKHLESAYFNSRTSDTMSYSSNAIRQKTFEMRSRNPLPALWGKIKGGITGTIQSLGDSLITIIFSSLALLGKNKTAKIGATGVVLSALYTLAREGFGFGKNNPMDK